MHIGLIGGIGVAATVVYYQRLTAAVEAAGGTLDLTIVHADVHELIHNSNAGHQTAQAKSFAPLIERLKTAGADCAAITSLGGHFCFDKLQPISALPLISAITPLDDYFAAQGVTNVGLLGTRVVMRTKLYGKLSKTNALALDDELEILGQSYQDMAVTGHCTDAQRALFLDAGHRMVTNRGADAIVLAGTDLNLAFDGQDTGYPVIDALDVHVDILARLAVDEISLQDLDAVR